MVDEARASCNIARRGTVYTLMRPMLLLVGALLVCTASAAGTAVRDAAAASAPPSSAPPSVRLLDLAAPDGTPLKASYFAAARPGPGVLRLHQRDLARQHA